MHSEDTKFKLAVETVIVVIVASCTVSIILFAGSSNCVAMEIRDGQLKIPTPEITLIWEHYCRKHIDDKEWHLARLNKKAIDVQRRGKLFWNSLPDHERYFQDKLKEAEKAKSKAGTTWGCNPPPSKLAFIGLKIGQDDGKQLTRSFIADSDSSIMVEGAVALVDSGCSRPEIEWNVSVPKYGVRKTNEPALIFAEGNENIAVPSSGLSSDETSLFCRLETTNETRKIGSFIVRNEVVICENVAYELSGLSAISKSTAADSLAIPKYPNGNRGADFEVDIEVKLSCDGRLSDSLTAAVRQDEQDQLRQEYLDMGKQTIPERNDLTSRLKTKHLTLDEFNSSQKVGGGKYMYILCKIDREIENVRNSAGDVQMNINSGYRNPYKNGKTSGSGRESQHIYGLAADIALDDFNGDGVKNKEDWDLMAQAAKSEGACVEPKNKAPSWIHMDWRGDCPSEW